MVASAQPAPARRHREGRQGPGIDRRAVTLHRRRLCRAQGFLRSQQGPGDPLCRRLFPIGRAGS